VRAAAAQAHPKYAISRQTTDACRQAARKLAAAIRRLSLEALISSIFFNFSAAAPKLLQFFPMRMTQVTGYSLSLNHFTAISLQLDL
jgi:hypothetical protein